MPRNDPTAAAATIDRFGEPVRAGTRIFETVLEQRGVVLIVRGQKILWRRDSDGSRLITEPKMVVSLCCGSPPPG